MIVGRWPSSQSPLSTSLERKLHCFKKERLTQGAEWLQPSSLACHSGVSLPFRPAEQFECIHIIAVALEIEMY